MHTHIGDMHMEIRSRFDVYANIDLNAKLSTSAVVWLGHCDWLGTGSLVRSKTLVAILLQCLPILGKSVTQQK